jgi:hypothetical protein
MDEDTVDRDAESCDSCQRPIEQGELFLVLYRYEDRNLLCSCPEEVVDTTDLMDSWIYHDRCAGPIRADATPCPRCGGRPEMWEDAPPDDDEESSA